MSFVSLRPIKLNTVGYSTCRLWFLLPHSLVEVFVCPKKKSHSWIGSDRNFSIFFRLFHLGRCWTQFFLKLLREISFWFSSMMWRNGEKWTTIGVCAANSTVIQALVQCILSPAQHSRTVRSRKPFFMRFGLYFFSKSKVRMYAQYRRDLICCQRKLIMIFLVWRRRHFNFPFKFSRIKSSRNQKWVF